MECLEVRSLLTTALPTAFAAQLSKLQSAVEKGPLAVLPQSTPPLTWRSNNVELRYTARAKDQLPLGFRPQSGQPAFDDKFHHNLVGRKACC